MTNEPLQARLRERALEYENEIAKCRTEDRDVCDFCADKQIIVGLLREAAAALAGEGSPVSTNYLEGASNAMRLAAIGTEQARKDWEDYKAVSPAGAEQEIDCPACGETVKQVASATLSLALWQHWNWTCQKRASSSAPADGEGWQPIETAPKDGAWILLRGKTGYVNRPYRVHVGQWRTRACGADGRSSVGWWEVSESGNFTDDGEPATHWMPLPAPPLSAVPRREDERREKQ